MTVATPSTVLEELARSRNYLTLLSEMMETLSQTPDVDGALVASALGRIAAAMEAEAGAVFLLDGELGDPRARLVCRASHGPVNIQGLSLPADAGIVGRVVTAGHAQLVADVSADPDFVQPPTLGARFVVRSIMCAPLAAMGRVVGAVEILNRIGGSPFTGQDLEALTTLSSAAALAIVNADLAREHVRQQKLQRELELAGTVQRSLLPRDVPADADVHGLNRAARGVSGDFYDILPLSDGRTVFALADVSGKGMNAALIMVKAATLFRSWARRVTEPGRLLARVESELFETMTLGMFVTMIVGVYDPATRVVRLSNAGHEPPLLRDAAGTFTAYPASDPPLGIVCRREGNRYKEETIALEDGALYLYTDGATDGRLPGGDAVGIEGVRQLIDENAGRPATQRLEAIADRYDPELRDDLTWLVVENAECARTSRRTSVRRRVAGLLVSQTLPAQSDQLKVVRRLVEAAAMQAGATTDWAADLALAVDEACQNIIRHGYRGAVDGRIRLSIRHRGDGLEVELEDTAPSVTGDDCQGRDLEELRPGGLGTHFMQRLTDGIRFLAPREGVGNRLLLTKTLPASGEPSSS